jgi:hypothetical protein
MLPRKLVDIQHHQKWRVGEKSLHQKELIGTDPKILLIKRK